MNLFFPKLALRVINCIGYRTFGFPFQIPYKITFSVTYLCNSRCKICGIWKIYKEKPELMKKELGLDDIDLMFRNLGNSILWLSLTGGEPFMRNDLVGIVESATKNCKNLSVISINTNGLATDKILVDMERILSINPSRKFFVVVSLDGTKEVHDRLRGIKYSYDKTTDTIYSLKEISERYKNLEVYAEATVGVYNIENINELLESDICKECAIAFTFAQNSDYYNNEEYVDVPSDYIQKVIGIIEKTSIPGYGNMPTKIFYKLARKQLSGRSKQIIPCYSSFASVFIDPYGNVKPCIMMNSIKNLENYEFDLRKLLMDDSFKEIQRKIKRGECPRCWTPCEALQTIVQNFPLAYIKSERI